MRYIFKSKTGEVTHEITASKPLKRREIKKQLRLSDEIAAAKKKSAKYVYRKTESTRARAKERKKLLKEVKENLPYYREKREKRERAKKRLKKVAGAFKDARRGKYAKGYRKRRKTSLGISLGGVKL